MSQTLTNVKKLTILARICAQTSRGHTFAPAQAVNMVMEERTEVAAPGDRRK